MFSSLEDLQWQNAQLALQHPQFGAYGPECICKASTHRILGERHGEGKLVDHTSRTWRTTQIDSKISRQDIGYTVYTPSFVPAVKLPPDFAARRIAWL